MAEIAADGALSRPRPVGLRLAGSFLILCSGELLAKVAAFIAFAYLARALGPTEFGYVEFAISIVTVLAVWLDCGLSTYAAREVAKQPSSVSRITVHILLLHYVLAALCYVGLVALVLLMDKPWPLKQFLLLFGLSMFGLSALIPGVFQGRGLTQYVALASVVRWSVFAAAVFLFEIGRAHV